MYQARRPTGEPEEEAEELLLLLELFSFSAGAARSPSLSLLLLLLLLLLLPPKADPAAPPTPASEGEPGIDTPGGAARGLLGAVSVCCSSRSIWCDESSRGVGTRGSSSLLAFLLLLLLLALFLPLLLFRLLRLLPPPRLEVEVEASTPLALLPLPNQPPLSPPPYG